MSVFNDEIEENAVLRQTEQSKTKWEMWCKTVTDLHLQTNVAQTYATKFVNNGFNFSAARHLNDNLLKSLPIDAAKHRTQISDTKTLEAYQSITNTARSCLSTSTRPATTIGHCSQHSGMGDTDKCQRCKGPVCSDCQHQLPLGPSIVTYCEKCIDRVSCSIQ